ncbi:hypothetical protein D9756_002057 [Leucocoprinus leucothites]|uniref:glutathione transferase n=1 Tax=Leucocoprinus leucothites TaxID=201217 RepID=A0A8H5LLP9_9AGAR|nr:hypothetical protein D9756_002057 [Leucoagaricus leucothites]
MVLKIYGHPLSTPSKLVAAICYEKEVPFEFITLDLLKGESRNPEHMARNPWGKVPVIDDDGFILYESRAIARYIADKYAAKGPQLIPSDIHKRALLEQAISSEAFTWDRAMLPILLEAVYKKYQGLESDPAKVEELTKTLCESLDVYEKILAKQKYIAGDELTIADFYFLPAGSGIQSVGINVLQERPNVARWFNETSSRSSWQKASAISA